MPCRKFEADHIQSLEPRRLLSFTLFGTDTNVTPDLPPDGHPFETDLAVADNGSYIVASYFIGGETQSLNLTRFSSQGRQIGAPIPIVAAGDGATVSSLFSISMDADGDAVVAFNTFTTEGADVVSRIFFTRISKSGELSPSTLLAEGLVDDPAVSMDASGGFFIAWHTGGFDDFGTDSVRVATFNAKGRPRGPRFDAHSQSRTQSSALFGVEIASNPDGSGAVFGFTSYGEGGGNSAVIGRVSTTARIGQVMSLRGSDGPSPAVHPDGSFVVGFERYSNNDIGFSTYECFVRRFDASGEQLGRVIDVGAGLSGKGIQSISVDTLSDGGFVVAFAQSRNNVNTIYARRYDASGVSETAAPVLVNRGPVQFFSPPDTTVRIGAADNGTSTVAFRELDEGSTTAHYRRLTPQIAAIDKDVLYALGTDAGERINVKHQAQSLVVTRGQTVRRFDPAQVSSLSISGFGGADAITNATTLPSTLDGGDDDDLVVAGRNRHKLLGGDGDDTLFGGLSGDLLYGQNGDDLLFGAEGEDKVNGGAGEDTLHGNGGNDLLNAIDRQRDRVFGDGGRDTAAVDELDILDDVEAVIP